MELTNNNSFCSVDDEGAPLGNNWQFAHEDLFFAVEGLALPLDFQSQSQFDLKGCGVGTVLINAIHLRKL